MKKGNRETPDAIINMTIHQGTGPPSLNVHALLAVILLYAFLFPATAFCKEARGRYTTLRYSEPELLDEFNSSIRLNRELRYYVSKRNIVTVEDEVVAKIDTIIEKAEIVLDMFPENLHITVVLLESSGDVGRAFKEKYGKKANHIAFYSLSEDTIYISVDDARLRVLAHEIGHAIVDHFFKVRPPYNIHELMAQFAEKHITD